jgi:hypothetical protein
MSQPQPAKPNKRRSRRQAPKKSTRVACYKGSLGLGQNLALTVLDVSETGIRLLINTELTPGQEVLVNLEGASPRPVKLPGRLIWSVPAGEGRFCVGVQFEKSLPYADLQALARV